MTSDYAKSLNDILDYFDNANYKPQAIKNVEAMLEQFYMDTGKRVSNPRRFNSRIKLNEDDESTLYFIGETLLLTTNDLWEHAEKVFEKHKNKYGWQSVDEAFSFIDKISMYASDSFIRSVLSSEQILSLFEAGESKGLSEDEIMEMIYIDYSTSGLTYDALYNRVLAGIMTYDEKSESWD